MAVSSGDRHKNRIIITLYEMLVSLFQCFVQIKAPVNLWFTSSVYQLYAYEISIYSGFWYIEFVIINRYSYQFFRISINFEMLKEWEIDGGCLYRFYEIKCASSRHSKHSCQTNELDYDCKTYWLRLISWGVKATKHEENISPPFSCRRIIES